MDRINGKIVQNPQRQQAKIIKVSNSMKVKNPFERRHMLIRVDTLQQDNIDDDPGEENLHLTRNCNKNYMVDSSRNQQEQQMVLFEDSQSMDGDVCLLNGKAKFFVTKSMPVLESSPVLEGDNRARSAAVQGLVNQAVLKMAVCSTENNACGQKKHRENREKIGNRDKSGECDETCVSWEGNPKITMNRHYKRCSNDGTLVGDIVDLPTNKIESFNLNGTEPQSHQDIYTRSQILTQSSQKDFPNTTQARIKQSRNTFTRTSKYKDCSLPTTGNDINQIKMDNDTVLATENLPCCGFSVSKESKCKAMKMFMQYIYGLSKQQTNVHKNFVHEISVNETPNGGLHFNTIKDFRSHLFNQMLNDDPSKLDCNGNLDEDVQDWEPSREHKCDVDEAVFAERSSKRNMNTNAHGDPTTHTTIITTNKPTHGSQKFLVRKDKQWNAGDGCDPSYVIHIESQTDQAASSNAPSWMTGAPSETRRRRGDIIKMKRMDNDNDQFSKQQSEIHSGITSSRSCFSEIQSTESPLLTDGNSSNDAENALRHQSYSSASGMITDFEALSYASQNGTTRKDRRNNVRPGLGKASSRPKTEVDGRSFARTSQGNVSMRLIDHLEKKEVHRDRDEENYPKVDEINSESNAKSGHNEMKEMKPGRKSFELIDNGEFSAAEHVTMLNPCATAAAKNFKIEFKKDDKIIWKKECEVEEKATCTKENKRDDIEDSNNAKSPQQRTVEPRSRNSPIRRKNGQSSHQEKTYDQNNLYNPGWSMEHIMPFLRMTSVKDAASQYSPPTECVSLSEKEVNSNIFSPHAADRENDYHKDLEECVCRRLFQKANKLSTFYSEKILSRKQEHQSRAAAVFHRYSPYRGNSAPSEISSVSTVRRKCSTSRCAKPQRRAVAKPCENVEDGYSEMSRTSRCSGKNSSLQSNDNLTPNDLLPEWSTENYNPNANFGVETSSPRTFGAGNRIHFHISPSITSLMGSFPDIENVTNSEARLNENFSKQRSRISNESDAEEEEVILEPMTPPVLLKTIPQGEPSPRYSAPMSLEKLQKLIEDAKASSRTNVKIKDHNTNFDREITFDEKPSEEMSNSFIGEYLYKLWKNECLCDVKVTVGGVDFFVHKLVLAAFSNVFCPSTPQPPPTVSFNVPCSTPDAVRQIFNYIYTSTMELRDELLDPILSAAIFMGITEVVEILNEILLKPNMENIEMYIEIKSRHGMCSSLADFPHLYRNYFVELSNRDTFFNMKVCEFEAVLQDPDVLVCSELDTIGAIANWIKYDPVARIKDLPKLLKYVSFESISPKVLATVSEKYNYLFSVPGAPQIISEAFKFHALKLETQCGMCSPHRSSPEKAGRKNSKVTLDLPSKKSSLARDTLDGGNKVNKYQKDSFSIPDINHSSTPIANPLAYKSFPKKESNTNAIRLDTQPSVNPRKFRKSSAEEKVGYNDVIHRINMKRNTPLMAATPSGQAIKNSSNMQLHLGGTRRPTVNGEPQMWTAADGDTRMIHMSNNNRSCNTPRKFKFTQTGHLRSRSRAGKLRRHRHYPVGSFNNNAADYCLLTQSINLSSPSGQTLTAGPDQMTDLSSSSGFNDNDGCNTNSNVRQVNDTSPSSDNNPSEASNSSNIQVSSPHLENMECDIQEGSHPKSIYGEKQSLHLYLSDGYKNKSKKSRQRQNVDSTITLPKTTRRKMEEKISPAQTDGPSSSNQPEEQEHDKFIAFKQAVTTVGDMDTFESKPSFVTKFNVQSQDHINFMSYPESQRHANTDEKRYNYYLDTVRNAEKRNKILEIESHQCTNSVNDMPLRQEELESPTIIPMTMFDQEATINQRDDGNTSKPENWSTLKHHDCRRVDQTGILEDKKYRFGQSRDKNDNVKSFRKHSLGPASCDKSLEYNITGRDSHLHRHNERCHRIMTSQDGAPESAENSAAPAGQKWTDQSITSLGHDDQASAFKRFQKSCYP